MRYLIVIVILFLLSSCGSNCSQCGKKTSAQNISSKSISENDTIEISGTLICTHCYALNENNTGLNHQLPESGFVENCAAKCAQQNYPIGVLMSQKNFGTKVWVIRTSGQLFTDYMTKTIKVRGLFITAGLIEPISIQVNDNENWITLL